MPAPPPSDDAGESGPIIPGKRPPGSKPPRAGLPVVVALGLSTLVLAGLLAAGFVWRGSLIAAWPPLQRLFGWLGLG